jgi:hypothetical protein
MFLTVISNVTWPLRMAFVEVSMPTVTVAMNPMTKLAKTKSLTGLGKIVFPV